MPCVRQHQGSDGASDGSAVRPQKLTVPRNMFKSVRRVRSFENADSPGASAAASGVRLCASASQIPSWPKGVTESTEGVSSTVPRRFIRQTRHDPRREGRRQPGALRALAIVVRPADVTKCVQFLCMCPCARQWVGCQLAAVQHSSEDADNTGRAGARGVHTGTTLRTTRIPFAAAEHFRARLSSQLFHFSR